MALPVTHVHQPAAAAPTPVAPSATFDERWAAWEAKGAAHERQVRRRLALGAPVAIAVVVVIVYLLGGL